MSYLLARQECLKLTTLYWIFINKLRFIWMFNIFYFCLYCGYFTNLFNYFWLFYVDLVFFLAKNWYLLIKNYTFLRRKNLSIYFIDWILTRLIWQTTKRRILIKSYCFSSNLIWFTNLSETNILLLLTILLIFVISTITFIVSQSLLLRWLSHRPFLNWNFELKILNLRTFFVLFVWDVLLTASINW